MNVQSIGVALLTLIFIIFLHFLNNPPAKKTSNKWHLKYMKKHGLRVYDPDGWDRKNINYSWYEEKITWEEFEKRALRSTLLPTMPERKIRER